MAKPVIEANAGIFSFSWVDDNIRIKVSRIRDDSRHLRMNAEILVEGIKLEDGKQRTIMRFSCNLLAPKTLSGHATELDQRAPGFDWKTMVADVAESVIEQVRTGEPVHEMWSSDDLEKPEYLVYPFMPLHQPTILFGEKETCKSLTGLILLTVMTLPWFDNPLGMTAPSRSYSCLVLDWETDHDEYLWRAKCLMNGMKLPPIPVNYRRCAQSLADDIEQIQHRVTEVKAEVLIIDSLMGAAGGDAMKSETATEFFAALRSLNVTSLIIAQTSKDQMGKKTILGSTIFQYYARSIWELRAPSNESQNGVIDVGVFHRFANMSRHYHPIGLRYEFDNEKDSTRVSLEDVRSVPQLLETMSLNQQILVALRQRPRNAAALVEDLDAKRNSVDQSLKRLRDKGIIVYTNDIWGLVAYDKI